MKTNSRFLADVLKGHFDKKLDDLPAEIQKRHRLTLGSSSLGINWDSLPPDARRRAVKEYDAANFSNRTDPLADELEGYFDEDLKDLPEAIQSRYRIDLGPGPLGIDWDSLPPEARRRAVKAYEAANYSNKTDEFIVGWWESSMQASLWWRADNVTPGHAAMLLLGYNPNKCLLEQALRSTNDEGAGPEHFRGLLNLLEAADPSVRRTLKDWADYAKKKGVKTHSWLDAWQAAKKRIGRPDENNCPPATVSELAEAFNFTDLDGWKTLAGNAGRIRALKEARRSKGTRGRGHAEPTFDPYLICLWLVETNRMTNVAAWKAFERYFPSHYEQVKSYDPRV